MTGAEVVAEARRWLGVRYKHLGRSRGGVDCIGLPTVVRQALGLAMPHISLDYAPAASGRQMLDFCRQHMVQISELQPGDLAVMDARGNPHMGIVADYVHGGLSLIHARSISPRRVTENRLSDDWMRAEAITIVGRFRFPEVTP